MSHKGTAVITGAVTAIGLAFAEQLALRGYDLILIANDRARLLATAARITDMSGRSVEVMSADLSATEHMAHVEGVLGQDASITLLVNHHESQAKADALAVLALGVSVPMRLSFALASGLVTRGTGALINLISLSDGAIDHNAAIESASGAFVLSLSQALHRQLGDAGVRVQTVLYAGPWPVRRQQAASTVGEVLKGFDADEAVTLPGQPDRLAWNRFEAARIELLGRLAGRNRAADVAPHLH